MLQVVHEGQAAGGPLATFWLQCYNHEEHVEEAVQSALAQKYRPLEIVVSDDGSSDRTFTIVSSIARTYAGPHRVVLYRSEQNRGIFPHWNEVAPHVQGAFVVWGSGDDVSEPTLVESFVAAWRQGGVSSVWCAQTIIDGNGTRLGTAEPTTRSLDLGDFAEGRFLDFTYGGTQGFERSVIDRFGALPVDLACRGLEHQIAFRSALMGGRSYVPEPLVRKRRHLGRKSIGMNARDQFVDPLLIHERIIQVRLQVLTSCRSYLVGSHGTLIEPQREALADALRAQVVTETERLNSLRSFMERRARSSHPAGPEFQHAGLRYHPNGLTLVRELDGGLNLLAAECRYHAVPQTLGPIEPCGLRNGRYPGVISGWTEVEVLAALEARNQSQGT